LIIAQVKQRNMLDLNHLWILLETEVDQILCYELNDSGLDVNVTARSLANTG